MRAWPIKPFVNVAVDFINGGTPNTKVPEYWDGPFPWITGADIIGNAVNIGRRHITQIGIENSATNLIPKNSLLLVTRTGVGKVALAPCDLTISQDITAVLLPKEIIPKFALYWWTSLGSSLQTKSQGAIIKGLTRKDVERLPFPDAHSREQNRIVEILDQADALRRQRAAANTQVSRLLPALFRYYFGDPNTNSKKWPMEPLGKLGVLDRGKSQHRPRNAPELFGGPYPFIQTGDVRNASRLITSYSQTYSELGLTQSKLWPAGTLCITIAANIAETAVLTFDACFPDSIVGFQPGPDVTIEYIQEFISSQRQRLENLAPQAAQKNINLEVLREISTPLPPKPLQIEFSHAVNNFEAISNASAASTTKLETLFQVLLQRAFDGRLTAQWREAHAAEILQEMEAQSRS